MQNICVVRNPKKMKYSPKKGTGKISGGANILEKHTAG
jgi:hypothetical protein